MNLKIQKIVPRVAFQKLKITPATHNGYTKVCNVSFAIVRLEQTLVYVLTLPNVNNIRSSKVI